MENSPLINKTVLIVDVCQWSSSYNNCLLDALTRKGCEVIYATTFLKNDQPIPQGVKVRYCFFHLARIFAAITSSCSLRSILRAIEYPFDIFALVIYILRKRIKLVHYMWPASPSIDSFVLWIFKKIGCRIVYTAHNPIQHDHKKRNVKEMMRIYHQTDHVIALTNYTRKEIIKLTGMPNEQISVIAHGDYGYVFSKYSNNESLAEEVLRKASGRRILAFMGIIRPYKGLEYFIKAFPLIKNAKSDVFFLVAGSSRFTNQQQLKNLIAENCAPEECHVDMRYLPVEDMKAYLSVTDVLIQPYVTASQSGNTAMAYSEGVPVISTNVGGLGEMVEDGQTGYIIPPQDPQAIADAVEKCFENNNWPDLSKNARKISMERYSWDILADQTLAAYQKALK